MESEFLLTWNYQTHFFSDTHTVLNYVYCSGFKALEQVLEKWGAQLAFQLDVIFDIMQCKTFFIFISF